MPTKTALSVGQVTEIAHSELMPDPDQPRKSFDEQGLAQLADSISKRGVLVPLQVRAGQKGKYIIHDGERRYRAARLAKLKTVPVLLVNSGDPEEDLRTNQLAVNNLREQLKPMEIARLLSDLQSKHFASTNDLAAHLERNGLPPMKPKEIQQTIQLCDLPEKIQAMIDAGELETAAAAQMYCVLQYPKVLKDVVSGLSQAVNWRGRITSREVQSEIKQGLRRHAADLNATESWHSNPVLFNPKIVCKGCEHLVSIDGSKFCMNVPEFERHNAEAKEAGLLPGGKKPTKSTPPGKTAEKEAEQKAEQRTQTLQEKCRDYLHAYLANRIITHMRQDINITDELLTWHAMQRPGAGYNDRRPAVSRYESSKEAAIVGLESLFATPDLAPSKRHAAIEIAHSLPWRETQVICHQLWGTSIETVWQMDEAFVNLFRKAELLHLVEQHQLSNSDDDQKAWGKLKGSDLKSRILERASQVTRPLVLQTIYEQIEQPHTKWSDRYGDSDGDDGPDECPHGISAYATCPECEEAE